MFLGNRVDVFYIQIQTCCFMLSLDVNVSHGMCTTETHKLTLWSWSGFVHAPILTPKTEAPNATRTHHPTSFFSKRHRERVSEGTEERRGERQEEDWKRDSKGSEKREQKGKSYVSQMPLLWNQREIDISNWMKYYKQPNKHTNHYSSPHPLLFVWFCWDMPIQQVVFLGLIMFVFLAIVKCSGTSDTRANACS